LGESNGIARDDRLAIILERVPAMPSGWPVPRPELPPIKGNVMTPRERLQALADKHQIESAVLLKVVLGYVDAQEAWWTTPQMPGSRPVTWEGFLDDLEKEVDNLDQAESAAPNETGASDRAAGPQAEEEAPVTATAVVSSGHVNGQAPASVRQTEVVLSRAQLGIVERQLAEYEPAKYLAPNEKGESGIGYVFIALKASFEDNVKALIKLRAGEVRCYVDARLYVADQEVLALPPRISRIEGEYAFKYEGTTYLVVVLPPTDSAKATKKGPGSEQAK
jgi:hypothetical protein